MNKTTVIRPEPIDALFPPQTQYYDIVNKARDIYIQYEKKNLEERISDLEQTLAINKQIMNEYFSGQKETVLSKLHLENTFLHQKLKQVVKDNMDLASEKLVFE